jgi:hypothetical protein
MTALDEMIPITVGCGKKVALPKIPGEVTVATELGERIGCSCKCSGGCCTEHLWIEWATKAGRYEGATAEKAVPFPSVALRS